MSEWEQREGEDIQRGNTYIQKKLRLENILQTEETRVDKQEEWMERWGQRHTRQKQREMREAG